MDHSLWFGLSVVILCAGFLGWRGYQRGVIRTLQRFIALLSAYAICFLLTMPLTHVVQDVSGWSAVQSMVASALVLFVVVYVAAALLMGFFANLVENQGVEPARLPACLIGVTLGSVFGLLLIWLGGILWDAMSMQSPNKAVAVVPQDPLRQAVGDVIGEVVERVMDSGDPNQNVFGQITGEVVSNPVQVAQKVMDVSNGPAMRAFFSDPFAQSAMLQDRRDILLKNRNFQALMSDPEAVSLLMMLSEQAGSDSTQAVASAQQKQQAARLLTDLYRMVDRVQKDQRFVELKASGAFDELARSASAIEMIRHPLFAELSEIVMDAARQTGRSPVVDVSTSVSTASSSPRADQSLPLDHSPAVDDGSESSDGPPPAAQKIIYRWIDEEGRKRYGDEMPKGDVEFEIISR